MVRSKHLDLSFELEVKSSLRLCANNDTKYCPVDYIT